MVQRTGPIEHNIFTCVRVRPGDKYGKQVKHCFKYKTVLKKTSHKYCKDLKLSCKIVLHIVPVLSMAVVFCPFVFSPV